jgi:hypothetical protein
MIKFYEQVPSVYPNASRDFQYLGWLIDIVLNSVKHNVDGLYELPNTTADTKLTELLAMTLGFKVKRNYDQKQLAALVAVLPRILKYKGTAEAITMAGKALIATSGAVGSITVEVSKGELSVKLPKNLVDVSLFTDLLPYILPAGMACRVIRTDVVDRSYETKFNYNDTVLAAVVPDFDWNGNYIGLANIFDIPGEPIFANFKNNNNSTPTPNIGLLDNSIIPMLASPVQGPTEDNTGTTPDETVTPDSDNGEQTVDSDNETEEN